MSCPPSYTYRPTFTPSNVKCQAPFFHEHRSRLTSGETFFRSIAQGPLTNQIEIEITAASLFVYFEGGLVETFPATLGPGGIAALRAVVQHPTTGSDYIEMPGPLFDIFDPRGAEDDILIGLATIPRSYLLGGSGPPTDDAGLAGIRTGPDRSVIILATTENLDGSPITPPWTRRVQQWTGSDWVTYANLVRNACPFIGTS